MTPKCSYCDFFGEKYHCNNCAIIGAAREHAPQKLTCSIKELVSMIENESNIQEKIGIGDYIKIPLLSGEVLVAIVLGFNVDKIWDEDAVAKVTFGVLHHDGLFPINRKAESNYGGYGETDARITVSRFFNMFPKTLRDHVVVVDKVTSAGGNTKDVIHSAETTFLLSAAEIFSEDFVCSYSNINEGHQYDYFANNKITPFKDVSATRSPYIGTSTRFIVVTKAGALGYDYATRNMMLPFGFCIGKMSDIHNI